MRRPPWQRRVAVVAAVAALAAACSSDEPEAGTPASPPTSAPATTGAPAPSVVESEELPPNDGDGELVVGTLLPATGDFATFGPGMAQAALLAAQEIEDAGGIPDLGFRLVEGDSGTDEDVAGTTVQRLLSQDVVDAVVGAASSRITESVIDTITGAEVVQCSPANTVASLTSYEDDEPGYYFRTAPPDDLQGPALAQLVLDDGHRDVAVIALDDTYGQGFVDQLEPALVEGGASVVVDVAYDPNGADFSSDVDRVVDAEPDAVVLVGYPDTGTSILTGLLEEGVFPDELYTADSMRAADVVAGVDPNDPTVLDGMRGTAPSSQGSPAFEDAFTAFAPTGTPQFFSAHTYDCVTIVAIAAAVAGTDAPDAVAAEMVGVTRDGEPCSSFASCLVVVEDGGDPDYDGASGAGEWIDAGEPSTGTYDVWEFREGEVVTVETVDV